MNASRGLRRLRWVPLALALALPLGGCEDDTTPVITKLDAFPICDIMTDTGNGAGLDVTFFARASSGNRFDDPTGGNSPLEWRWDFGDGGSATNQVGPTHRYTSAGTYEVTLTVEDKDGQKVSSSITIFVGEQYTDLDIVLVDSELVGTAPVFNRDVATGVTTLAGWEATFSGTLNSNCVISGLFQQYTWDWAFGDGESMQHVDNPTHRYAPTVGAYTTVLEITEVSTGVARETSVDVVNPAGLSLPLSPLLLAGQSFTARVNAHLLQGMTQLDATLEYDTALLTLDNAVVLSDLTDGGFTPSLDTSTPGVIDISFVRASPLGSDTPDWGLLDLSFTVATINVEAGMPITSPIGVASFEVLDGSAARTAGSIDGAARIDSDCNQNGRADTIDVTEQALLYDLNSNGIVDSCEGG